MKREKSKKIIISIIVVLLAILFITGYFISLIIRKNMYPIKYDEYVVKYSKEYNVPKDLIYAVIYAESSFDENAKSPDGAIGLMQIMPDTFKWLSSLIGESYVEGAIYQSESNIKYGVFYLSFIYERFNNWDTVVAGYNAGHNKIADWLADTRYSDDKITLKEIPYDETRNYVEKVKRVKKVYIDLYFEDEYNSN